jgi:hypothetical protein
MNTQDRENSDGGDINGCNRGVCEPYAVAVVMVLRCHYADALKHLIKEGNPMRKLLFAIAAAAAMAAGSTMMSTSASAVPLTNPAAIDQAVKDVSPTTQVAYVCRRVWTRFGWRRTCGWRPNRVVVVRPGWRRGYGWHRGWHGRRWHRY